MSNDYLKKEPSKTEKMLYELAVNQNQMQKGLWSTSTVAMALALSSNVKAEDLAELIVNGKERIQVFSDKVNEIIKNLEADKHKDSRHVHEET
jgi:hypothetical protein